ncbi:MAG: Asp-tRNA(Asn)/Glu-tRNA(Gln) amidotransferase subunit GatC [Elusimicrobiales bacterium]
MDVEKIASLSKIRLTDDEKKILEKDFKKIVEWVDEINLVDISNIGPFLYEGGFNLRDDIPFVFEGRKRIVDNFPAKEFDFIKVKKVID